MTYIKRGLFHFFMLCLGSLLGYLLLKFTGHYVIISQPLAALLMLLFMALSLGVSLLLAPRILPLSAEAAILPAVRKQNWAWLRPKGTTSKAGFPLNKDYLVIGREVQCAIMLNDNSVSRQHSAITRLSEGYLLRDLGSSNGTFVNGQRIQEYLLQDGDRVSIGDIEFWFEAPADTRLSSQSAANSKGIFTDNSSISGQGFSLDPSGSLPFNADADEDEEGTESWSPRPEQIN